MSPISYFKFKTERVKALEQKGCAEPATAYLVCNSSSAHLNPYSSQPLG